MGKKRKNQPLNWSNDSLQYVLINTDCHDLGK